MRMTERPRVMGILNTTPDSFSDGGRFTRLDRALEQVERMVAAGADIIDVGGESTRPGAAPVAAQEEIERVVPVIEAIMERFEVPVSVDTSKAEVMRAAVAAGATMINDVRALREPGALEAAAETKAEVFLMHMRGEPRTMQNDPRYDDVVAEVLAFLEERVEACVAAGISRERIGIDPGFGFGKALTHNLTLLRELERFKGPGLPLLVGLSRKSMFGALTGRAPAERVSASVAAAALAAWMGADIVRVHDVAETVDALKVVCATRRGHPCEWRQED